MPYVLTQHEGNVSTITLNRPEKLNSFTGTMREDLLGAINAAGERSECRVVLLTGAGRAFCAGGDVESMSDLQRARNTNDFRRLLDAGREIITAVAAMSKPVIAVINGVAAGAGCNLALACDYRIASEQARLGQTFVRIGLHPDWGGTWFLPRLTGRSRAFEIMATGRMVDAAEALSIGMVDRVVPPDVLIAEAGKMANAFAAAPPIALAGIKRALQRSERNDLANQLDLETEHQLRAFVSRDATEGMAAFFEKRPPKFEGV